MINYRDIGSRPTAALLCTALSALSSVNCAAEIRPTDSALPKPEFRAERQSHLSSAVSNCTPANNDIARKENATINDRARHITSCSGGSIKTDINSDSSESRLQLKKTIPTEQNEAHENNEKELAKHSTVNLSPQNETQYLSDLLDKETPCFKIHSIKLVGEHADTFHDALDAINAKEKNMRVNPLHHCIGAKAINVMMKKVQNKLISAGYITTRIVAQPQDLNTGILFLTVIPGLINNILIDQQDGSVVSPMQWNSIPMEKGELLNLRQIEQTLENYQRVPSVDIDIKIVPARGLQAKPGASDLHLTWQQKRMLRSYISFDNSGSKNTGVYQGSINLSIDNLLAMSDILSISMVNDLGGGNKGRRGNNSRSLQFTIPFDNHLIAFSTNQYRYHQTVSGAWRDYLYSGNSSNRNFTVSQMLHRDANSKTKLDLSFWKRTSINFLGDTELHFQTQQMAGFDLTLLHKAQFGQTHAKGSVTYRNGNENSPDTTQALSSKGKAGSRYYTGVLQINHLVKIFGQNAWYQLALKGQWNKTPLVQQDHFSIGSRYSVRGFSGERTLSAEQGYTARNELIFTIKDQQIYLAADYGKVDGPSSERLIGQFLSGWGVGVRGHKGKLHGDLFVGFPMDYPDRFKPDPHALTLNIGASF